MYAPAQHDEITGLMNYIAQQLDALRASVYGLTEAQARETPCRSTLSLAALVKHAAHGMRGYTERALGDAKPLDGQAFSAYMGSLAVAEDESVIGILGEFDAAREAFFATLQNLDPDADVTEPPAPWQGVFDEHPAKARFDLVHVVEEFARHAGHADIIREQLDGMAVPTLVMTLEGVPANEFFQPYEPTAGTIGA
jgi:hypothetical protein